MAEHRSSAQLILEKVWYDGSWLVVFLLPFSLLFYLISSYRRLLFKIGFARRYRAPVPVIVVGNIHVGGTGKTPFIVTLVEYLISQGYKPGVISRGYGVELPRPVLVTQSSSAKEAGDEALLIALRCRCPVVSFPERKQAVKTLLEYYPECDVIISDDGLQHYALMRDIEIVLVDAMREFGNGLLLPAGPLRETKSRLNKVDFILCNGGMVPYLKDKAEVMQLEPQGLKALGGQAASGVILKQYVHAVTGISNPGRFFESLQQLDMQFDTAVFPDHHDFSASDFSNLLDRPIVMTEKDAVKCKEFARPDWWYLPVDAVVSQEFLEAIKARLVEVRV